MGSGDPLGHAWVWWPKGLVLGWVPVSAPFGVIPGVWSLLPDVAHMLTSPSLSPGYQGWGGDHMQVPRCVRFLHCADVLAAAGTLPRGGQTPEVQI